MKKFVVYLFVVCCLFSLTGCGNEDVKSLSSLKSVDTEANVSIVSISATDKENLIYSQVSDRTLLDLTTLESPTAEEVDAVKVYMDSVDAQLCGTLSEENGVIDSCFTNYLLFEFEKTPYYWQREKMSILGVDSSSRSVVLDVQYKTINFPKTVKGDSTIVRGEPNYDTKSEVRLNRYLDILDDKYGSRVNVDWESELALFESVYGSVEEILKEQQSETLTNEVFTYGNQITYTGLVNNEIENTSRGTMVIRYVLTPRYSLGINLGLNCTHMYIVSYNLDSAEVNNEEYLSTVYNDETGITDEVKSVLSRYYTCIDDENYTGLYSLVRNFGSLDKYFSDYFSTAYHKYDDFSVTVHSVQGTRIECTSTVSRKVRARGSSMSLPIYTDTYYYVLSLDDGVLKVEEEILLSSKLEGEPAIDTTDADVSGFSTSIDLTSQDKLDMENLIAQFGVLQMKSDSSSSAFTSVVDTSIASSQLSTLRDNMTSIEGTQKVTWVSSYLQGQGSYASIRCKESVQKEDGTVYDCVVTYDFIKKGGEWYIYGYTVNSKNKLDSATLSTKNCLCLVTADGVDVMNSKVTVSKDENTEQNVVVGETVNYEEYEPTVKVPVDNGEFGSGFGVGGTDGASLVDQLMGISDVVPAEVWEEKLMSDVDLQSQLSEAMLEYNNCLQDSNFSFTYSLNGLKGKGIDDWVSAFEEAVKPYTESAEE